MAATICPRCRMSVEIVQHAGKPSYNVHQIARRRGAPRCPNSLRPLKP